MAPCIHEYPSEDERSGSGIELFLANDTPVDAKFWWEQNRISLPSILTAESLATAPDSALAIFRFACRVPLLEDMQVGIPLNEHINLFADDAMAQLVPNNLELG